MDALSAYVSIVRCRDKNNTGRVKHGGVRGRGKRRGSLIGVLTVSNARRSPPAEITAFISVARNLLGQTNDENSDRA